MRNLRDSWWQDLAGAWPLLLYTGGLSGLALNWYKRQEVSSVSTGDLRIDVQLISQLLRREIIRTRRSHVLQQWDQKHYTNGSPQRRQYAFLACLQPIGWVLALVLLRARSMNGVFDQNTLLPTPLTFYMWCVSNPLWCTIYKYKCKWENHNVVKTSSGDSTARFPVPRTLLMVE